MGRTCCLQKIVLIAKNNFCTQHVLPRFELGIFILSYCGLVDAKIRASDKDLPVMSKELVDLFSKFCGLLKISELPSWWSDELSTSAVFLPLNFYFSLQEKEK